MNAITPRYLRYAAPGPVAAQFLISRARVRAIMGPIGSGKTGAALMSMLYLAREQAPHPVDGVRRTRFAVVRKTYRDLERTVIKSWHRWVPKPKVNTPSNSWTGGSGGQPATHILEFHDPRPVPGFPNGTTVHLEVIFLAIGENDAEQVLKGFEVTGFYLNEADQLDEEVLDYADSRVGRYPEVDEENGFAGATWCGVWLDFNAPDSEHWLYKAFIDELPDDWAFFRQPAAMLKTGSGYVLNPRAENLKNLREGYYEKQIIRKKDWWIRRNILNEFGASREGKPVYDEFDDVRMVVSGLKPIPGIPLVVGGDAGLTPAAVITQKTPFGQMRVLAELVTPEGEKMGAKTFGRALRTLIDSEFPGYECEGCGDPTAGSLSQTDEQTWLTVMSAVTGFPWRPAPTNKPLIRIDSVREPLSESIDGEPGFLITPECKRLRKGFNAGYRFRKRPNGTFEDEPEKNEFSHVHDALQYAALRHGFHIQLLGRQQASANQRRQVEAITDDNPQGGWVEPAGGRQAYAEVD